MISMPDTMVISTCTICSRPSRGLPCHAGRCTIIAKIALKRVLVKSAKATTTYISTHFSNADITQVELISSDVIAIGSKMLIMIGVTIPQKRFSTFSLKRMSSHSAFVRCTIKLVVRITPQRNIRFIARTIRSRKTIITTPSNELAA